MQIGFPSRYFRVACDFSRSFARPADRAQRPSQTTSGALLAVRVRDLAVRTGCFRFTPAPEGNERLHLSVTTRSCGLRSARPERYSLQTVAACATSETALSGDNRSVFTTTSYCVGSSLLAP